jgi:SAM-dependent methyltransferase
MNQAQIQHVENYFHLMTANGAAHVYRTAREMGVLDALKTGADTLEALSDRCGIEACSTALLMDCLAGLGLVERTDGRIRPAPLAGFLAEHYQDLGDVYWAHLPDYLRSGAPLVDVTTAAQGEDFYAREVQALTWMSLPAVAAAARELDIGGRRRGLRVLDAGAGAAVWSAGFALANESLKVVALDRPGVLDAAAAAAATAGIGDRFRTAAGDLFDFSFPPGSFDIAIVANVAHLFPPAQNRKLFAKIRDALSPGGEIMVFDVFPQPGTDNLTAALYALGLALRTHGGRTYTADAMAKQLCDAGFCDPAFVPLPAPPGVLGMMRADIVRQNRLDGEMGHT